MQLKHLPYCFLVVAAICLAGAFTASATPPEDEALQIASRR